MTSLLTISTFVALLAPAPEDATPAEEPTEAAAELAPSADPDAEPSAEPPEGEAAVHSPFEGEPGEADAPPDDAEAPSEPTEATAPVPPPETPTPAATPPPKKHHEPRPIRWRLDFGASFGSTLVSDPGYRAFNDRRHLPEATPSVLFDFRLAEGRFFLGGGLAYQRLGRNDGYARGLSTEIDLHEPEVQGRLSFMAIEGIDAFARFGVGPSIVDLKFYSTEDATQRAVIPRVDAQAGLSLYLPKPWLARKRASRVTAGINLGLGYTWRGTIAVQPDLSQDDEPLRATTAPWGDLSLRGLSWRLGLFVRVM